MSRILTQSLGAAAIAVFLLAAFTPSLDLLDARLKPDRPAERAEAIVVPGVGGVAVGGGLTDASLRAAMEGVKLFREGWAPLVVFSGPADGQRRAEADVRADFARQSGVPAASIMTVSSGRTTREEAVEMKALLQARGVRKVLLVVDGPGMVRAMDVFERVGFEVVPAPWSPGLNLERTPEDRLGLLREISMELVARLYYRVMGYR
ncbi:MAG: YdcF family protein [Candidatus Rokuibacteriota bacterium]